MCGHEHTNLIMQYYCYKAIFFKQLIAIEFIALLLSYSRR